MKKVLFLFVTAIMLLATIYASAETITSGECGDTFEWKVEANTLTLTGSGDMTAFADMESVPWNGYRDIIKEIHIPNGVTSISDYAFSQLSNAEKVFYTGSEESWADVSVGDINDDLEGKMLYVYAQGASGANFKWRLEYNGTLTLSGTGKMPSVLWRDYTSLIKKAVVEEGITSTGMDAFSNCENLTEIILPESITEIGDSFDYCTSLEHITLPKNVKSVAHSAFYHCANLKTIVLHGNITSMGHYAFDIGNDIKQICFIGDSETWGKYANHYNHPVSFIKDYGTLGENVGWYINNSGLLMIVGVGEITEEVSWDKYADEIKDVLISSTITGIPENFFASIEAVDTVLYLGTEAERESLAVADGNENITEAAWHYIISTHRVGTEIMAYISEGRHAVIYGNGEVKGFNYISHEDLDTAEIKEGITHLGSLFSAGASMVNLTDIKLPDGVVSFGDDFLDRQNRLSKLIFGYGVETIEAGAVGSVVETVVIPNSLKKLGRTNFLGGEIYYLGTEEEWANVTVEGTYNTVYFAKDGGKFGDNMAWHLNNEGVLTIIGDGRMINFTAENPAPWSEYSDSITQIVFTNDITYIGDYAFKGLNISNITVPKGVEGIGDYAYADNDKLTELMLYEPVTEIGEGAFDNCDNIEKVYLCGELKLEKISVGIKNDALNDGNVILITDKGQCGDNIFWFLDRDGILELRGSGEMYEYEKSDQIPWYKHRTKVLEARLSDDITKLASSTFGSCSNMTKVNIPANMLEVTGFSNILTVKCFIIPDGITSIGEKAFMYSSGTEIIAIPKSVTAAGSYAFWYNDGLTDVYYGGNEEEWAALYEAGDYSTNYDLFNANIHYAAAYGKINDTMVWHLGDNGILTIIGCGEMDDYSTENPAPWMAYKAMIKSVQITDTITYIGENAFYALDAKIIETGSGVTRIGESTFYGNAMLENIIIGQSVEMIETDAFGGCENVKKVYFLNEKTVAGDGNDALQNANTVTDGGICGEDAFWVIDGDTLRVFGSGELYGYENSTKTPWYSSRQSIEKLVIADTITYFTRYTFNYISTLTEVSLPEKLTVATGFRNCTALTTVAVPDEVTMIGADGFYYCYRLQSIEIPLSVKKIGQNAFYNASGLKDIYYAGTAEEWAAIEVLSGNTVLEDATVHYNCGWGNDDYDHKVSKVETSRNSADVTVTILNNTSERMFAFSIVAIYNKDGILKARTTKSYNLGKNKEENYVFEITGYTAEDGDYIKLFTFKDKNSLKPVINARKRIVK